MTKEHQELPINLNHTIHVYLHHFFSVSIILARDCFKPWYYQNYTNIFSYVLGESFNDYAFFDFLPPGYWDVLHQSYLPNNLIKEQTNIVDFITKMIDENWYVSIDLDEYYLPIKPSYQKYRYIHPMMIYGYNNRKREFLCIGIGRKNAEGTIDLPLFGKYSISYDELEAAYAGTMDLINSNPNLSPTFGEVIMLLKLKDWSPQKKGQKYNESEPDNYLSFFNCMQFAEDLKDYIHGNCGHHTPFEFHYKLDTLQGSSVKYGVDVLDVMIEYLSIYFENRSDSIFYPSQHIHLLFEHKRAIYERLYIVVGILGFEEKLLKMTDEYKKIVNSMNAIRFKYIKYQGQRSAESAKYIIEGIKKLKEREITLLDEIGDIIMKYPF
jgi:hypothetical protein